MSGYKIYVKIGTIMKWHKYEHENRNYPFVQMTSFFVSPLYENVISRFKG